MAQKRKLQVFVSSTYTDLIEERQAAVEAILTAGHIPAGMELFAGKNVEQMNIIQRWIDESDVYLLLLGGRYGSIDEESGKSYTHLEYEYAKGVNKPIFVVVASDKYIDEQSRERGADAVMELKKREEYLQFKKQITGKYVKHWDSHPTLQLAIINTIHVLDREENLVGWVRGNEAVDTGAIAEELARLTKENSELRTQVANSSKSVNNTLYNGLTFDQMYSLMNQYPLDDDLMKSGLANILTIVAEAFGDGKPSILHLFYMLQLRSSERYTMQEMPFESHSALHKLVNIKILEFVNSSKKLITITESGQQFLIRLQVERNAQAAIQLIADSFEAKIAEGGIANWSVG